MGQEETMARVPSILLVPSLLAGALLAGCGHPATAEECREIADRIVTLELEAQRVTDPAEVAKRHGQALAAFEGRFEGCVGKRVTDSAMACVRAAKTPGE